MKKRNSKGEEDNAKERHQSKGEEDNVKEREPE